MAETKMELADWFDELCARFIVNLPQEELESVERICFQVEEAQWFYEDFIRPLDPSLPSLKLKEFCLLIFRHCPILSGFQPWQHVAAYEEFLSYKNRVPVRGAIMLNEEMDQVVLVKGWKKGARWSFPRGKINKDEPDLECAIREVDEETGFDIQRANLVKDGENTKYIQVTMREQHMRLYVFRGVPMNTYFEPKTRKEISKISWWKLSDLPTVTRRGQQANEEDTAKANHFYMVAPFLGQLKSWIKDQRRRDRKRMAQPNSISGMEYSEVEDARWEEKSHMSRLMDDLRNSQVNDGSNNLPEVSSMPQGQPDNVAMLKGLLGVGAPVAPQPDLMSILHGNQPLNGPVPQTPLEQIMPGMPPQPRSPAHHHLRQAHYENNPPPFPGPQQFPPRQFPPPVPPGMLPPGLQTLPPQTPWFPGSVGPEMPGRPFGELNPEPHFHRSAVPPASHLPAPKHLSQQAMGLLNAFKSSGPAQPPVHRQTKSQSSSNLPQVVVPAPEKSTRKNHELDIASLLKDDPKPKRTHQRTEPEKSVPPQKQLLLDLFRRPAAIEKDAGPLSPQPVELSAAASPGVTPKAKAFQSRDLANDKTNLLVTASPSNGPAATVMGPLNAPDFEVIQSHQRRNTVNKPGPVSILARPKPFKSPSKSPPVPVHSVSPKTKLEAPKPFHPQILKRGQALAKSPPPVTIPTGPTPLNGKLQQNGPNTLFDRRGIQAKDQKSTLLSLFSKPSPPPTKPVEDGLAASHHQANIGASHVVSPVSPLPEKILQTPRATPPDHAKSSRISSITSNPGGAADAIKDTLMRSYEGRPNSGLAGPFFSSPKKMSVDAGPIGISKPQHHHHQQQSMGASKDRDFLLGYLQNVGKKGT